MTGALPNIADLTDPASFAAARRALDAAEQRARADAAEAKKQAEIEAQQAEEAAFAAEIDSLAGPWEPVVAARAALQNLLDRQAANAAEIKAAEQTVAQASTVLPRLVERAAAGEAVAPSEVAEAYAGKTTAVNLVTFLGIVATRFPPMIAEAEAVVKAAIAVAHQPVYERGVDLRIESAIMNEAARPVDRNGNWTGHTDNEARDAAWKTFQHANKLLHYAARKGVHIASASGISEYGPARPHMERRAWRRPAPDSAT